MAPATAGETGKSDPILTRLADEDKTPWYRKPNLRMLYFMLFPTCMGIELTSGFDSQMINALQLVPTWTACKCCLDMEPLRLSDLRNLETPHSQPRPDFADHNGAISAPLKGIIAAAYSLGAVLSLPFIPMVNDRFGRRWSIFGGSAIMCIGAIIQAFSQHGESHVAHVYSTARLAWPESDHEPHWLLQWPCTSLRV